MIFWSDNKELADSWKGKTIKKTASWKSEPMLNFVKITESHRVLKMLPGATFADFLGARKAWRWF